MRNAEMLVWAGDFNYRIDATYEDAIDHIRCNDLEYLLERVRNLSTCAFSYVTSSFSVQPLTPLLSPVHAKTQVTAQVAALTALLCMNICLFHILTLN